MLDVLGRMLLEGTCERTRSGSGCVHSPKTWTLLITRKGGHYGREDEKGEAKSKDIGIPEHRDSTRC
jgi:hypothetical protein